MKYEEVLRNVYKGDFKTVPERLLCLDPGNTTGWALFINGKLSEYGQIETVIPDTRPGAKSDDTVIDWEVLEDLFADMRPTYVVCENYRVYAHKLERHSFSKVETLRLIGGIDFLCIRGYYVRVWGKYLEDDIDNSILRIKQYYQPIPIEYQMAVQAKGFITDDRLKAWDFWKEGMRHSRDAIRHGLYFLIVTNRPK